MAQGVLFIPKTLALIWKRIFLLCHVSTIFWPSLSLAPFSFFFPFHRSPIATSLKQSLLLSREATEPSRPPRWTGDTLGHNQLCQAWLAFPQVRCSSWPPSQSLPHTSLCPKAGLCLAQPGCYVSVCWRTGKTLHRYLLCFAFIPTPDSGVVKGKPIRELGFLVLFLKPALISEEVTRVDFSIAFLISSLMACAVPRMWHWPPAAELSLCSQHCPEALCSSLKTH